jgi:hypothetical protein
MSGGVFSEVSCPWPSPSIGPDWGSLLNGADKLATQCRRISWGWSLVTRHSEAVGRIMHGHPHSFFKTSRGHQPTDLRANCALACRWQRRRTVGDDGHTLSRCGCRGRMPFGLGAGIHEFLLSRRRSVGVITTARCGVWAISSAPISGRQGRRDNGVLKIGPVTAQASWDL